MPQARGAVHVPDDPGLPANGPIMGQIFITQIERGDGEWITPEFIRLIPFENSQGLKKGQTVIFDVKLLPGRVGEIKIYEAVDVREVDPTDGLVQGEKKN